MLTEAPWGETFLFPWVCWASASHGLRPVTSAEHRLQSPLGNSDWDQSDLTIRADQNYVSDPSCQRTLLSFISFIPSAALIYEVAPIIHDCLLCVRYDTVVNRGDSAQRSSSLEQRARDWQRHTPVPGL